MKVLSIFTLSVFCFLFLFGCKKEDNTERISLTFKGVVTDQFTGAPIDNHKVIAVYGVACCGGIDQVKGLDSVTTTADGRYSLSINYPKDTVLYRHFVYPQGHSMRFRPLPPVTVAYTDWLIADFIGPYSVPETISDTLLNGRTITTDFKMVPGATLKINFNLDKVPQDRYLEIRSSAEGLPNPYNDDSIINFALPGEVNLKNGALVPLAGGRKNFVTCTLKTSFDGNLISETVFEITPAQGEILTRHYTF